MKRAFGAAFVLGVILALTCATSGADLVDLLACGVDCGAGSGADEEGACDHCPSCFLSHGHMQSLLAGSLDPDARAASDRFAPSSSHFVPRVAAQDIFHPPIAPAV